MELWQDLVIGIGNWIFAISLLPSIFGKNKPAWSTSLITAIVLLSFAYCFYTMGYLGSMAATITTAICWSILFLQVVYERIVIRILSNLLLS